MAGHPYNRAGATAQPVILVDVWNAYFFMIYNVDLPLTPRRAGPIITFTLDHSPVLHAVLRVKR